MDSRAEHEQLVDELHNFAVKLQERYGAHTIFIGALCPIGTAEGGAFHWCGNANSAYGMLKEHLIRQEQTWRESQRNECREDER